jgi:hypothetical protein
MKTTIGLFIYYNIIIIFSGCANKNATLKFPEPDGVRTGVPLRLGEPDAAQPRRRPPRAPGCPPGSTVTLSSPTVHSVL